MTDYLAEVGRKGRIFALICLSISTFFFMGSFVLVLGILLFDPPADREQFRAGIGSACVAGVLGFISTWMLVRLIRSLTVRGRKTLMPLWFIEFLGVGFGAVLATIAVVEKDPWMLLQMLPVIAAMIFVRRRLSTRMAASTSESDHADDSVPGIATDGQGDPDGDT